jgi:hypothetical protein
MLEGQDNNGDENRFEQPTGMPDRNVFRLPVTDRGSSRISSLEMIVLSGDIMAIDQAFDAVILGRGLLLNNVVPDNASAEGASFLKQQVVQRVMQVVGSQPLDPLSRAAMIEHVLNLEIDRMIIVKNQLRANRAGIHQVMQPSSITVTIVHDIGGERVA